MTEGPLLCGEGEKGSLRGHANQEQNDEKDPATRRCGQESDGGSRRKGHWLCRGDVRQKVARRGEGWTEGAAGKVAVP